MGQKYFWSIQTDKRGNSSKDSKFVCNQSQVTSRSYCLPDSDSFPEIFCDNLEIEIGNKKHYIISVFTGNNV